MTSWSPGDAGRSRCSATSSFAACVPNCSNDGQDPVSLLTALRWAGSVRRADLVGALVVLHGDRHGAVRAGHLQRALEGCPGLDLLTSGAAHVADAAQAVAGRRRAGQHVGDALADLPFVEDLLVQQSRPDEQGDGRERENHHGGDDPDDQALVRLLRRRCLRRGCRGRSGVRARLGVTALFVARLTIGRALAVGLTIGGRLAVAALLPVLLGLLTVARRLCVARLLAVVLGLLVALVVVLRLLVALVVVLRLAVARLLTVGGLLPVARLLTVGGSALLPVVG